MLRNPISYIFKLGKHQSLKLQPLTQLSADSESPSSTIPTPLALPKVPVKIEQAPHSNQMSS